MGRIVIVLLVLITAVSIYHFKKGFFESFKLPSKVEGVSDTVGTSNSWFPNKVVQNNAGYNISLYANSAILVDFDTGDIVFEKNKKERLPAASTIKIMTALIALENSNLTDTFTVSETAARVGEDSMNLTEGERLTLGDLLYGVMLVSGNDAAITIAEGIFGSEDAFVSKMNEKAKDLGLMDTKFINATGLDEDSERQYTTAFDLATLAHYVWENYPEFREISSTEHYFIEEDSNHKAFELANQTNLLTTYPGVKGIKPGFTYEAGLCLVTYAENGGKKLIGVILGSGDRRGEMATLLDFGFANYGIAVDHSELGF